MKEINVTKELDSKKWSEFVYEHPDGNIFQTPEMFEVYKNTRHWEPVLLAAIDNNENILGILLAVIQKEFSGFLGKLTARAVSSGGPLVVPGEDKGKVIDSLLKALDKEIKKKSIYAQFRNLYDFSKYQECFVNNGYTFDEHLDFISDLTVGEESLWGKLFPARRNKIRNADTKGVKVRIATEIAEIKKGYDILKEIYSRLKLPLAKKELFMAVYSILFTKNMASSFVATFEGGIIGVLCLLRYRDSAYVWYAGSSSRYYANHPNDILYWEAMKWCCHNGYKTFIFGGAGSPNEEYGVREFKKQFGGSLINYGRFLKVYNPIVKKFVDSGIKLLKRI